MKKLYFFFIFILAYIFVINTNAQTNAENGLRTETFKVGYFKFSCSNYVGFACENSQDTKFFLDTFSPLLSEKGSLEVEQRSNTVIITDQIKRVQAIKSIIEGVDSILYDAFTDKETKENDDLITLEISTKYLLPFYVCRGFAYSPKDAKTHEEEIWIDSRGNILMEIVLLFFNKSSIKKGEGVKFDGEDKKVIINVPAQRAEFLKRLVVLFDQPTPSSYN